MQWDWNRDSLVTLYDLAEGLRLVFFWPGDTLISWLLEHHPQLANALGLSAASHGELVSALLSAIVAWGTFVGLCHLMLWAVQLREAIVNRRGRDIDL